MKVIPTQKLFYNRFTHCIKVNVIKDKKGKYRGETKFADIRTWMTDNNIPNRTRLDWHTVDSKNVSLTLGIYFSDKNAYDYILNNHSDMVVWVSKPINQSHHDLLLNKTEIEFKDKLYYKNFRYKILFRPRWSRESRFELVEQIRQIVDLKQHGRKMEYFFINNFSPALYIKNDTDVVMFKLSMSDEIKKVVKVELYEEHGVTPDSIKP